MSEQLIGFIVGAAFLVAGWCFTVWFKNKDDKKQADVEQVKKNEAEIGKLAESIEKIKDKQEEMARQILSLDFPLKLLWAKAQESTSAALHHPKARFKEMDDLLDKLNLKDLDHNGDILPMTEADTARLKELLHHRSTDMSEGVTDYEREQAKIMPTVMANKVIEEQKGAGGAPVNVELIGEVEDKQDTEKGE